MEQVCRDLSKNVASFGVENSLSSNAANFFALGERPTDHINRRKNLSKSMSGKDRGIP